MPPPSDPLRRVRPSGESVSKLTEAPTAAARTRGMPCSVCVAIDALDDESRADFDAWTRGERPELGTDLDMWHRLQALGARVGRQTVGRHRRGECRAQS